MWILVQQLWGCSRMEVGITTELDNDLIKTQLHQKAPNKIPPIPKCLYLLQASTAPSLLCLCVLLTKAKTQTTKLVENLLCSHIYYVLTVQPWILFNIFISNANTDQWSFIRRASPNAYCSRPQALIFHLVNKSRLWGNSFSFCWLSHTVLESGQTLPPSNTQLFKLDLNCVLYSFGESKLFCNKPHFTF